MVTAAQSIDEDTLEMLGMELGYIRLRLFLRKMKTVSFLETFDIDLEAEEIADADHLQSRPPVVTMVTLIMVKTKL